MGVFDKPPDQGGKQVNSVTVQASAHPLGFVGLRMQAPTLLEPATPGVASWELWSKFDKDAVQRLLPDGHALRMGQINPMLFAQLLAKIAYGYAVATYGYAVFLSLVHPLLQSSAAEFSDVIGGDYEIPESEESLVYLETYEMVKPPLRYLCVKIRLWPMLGTPVYRVVVGVLPDSASQVRSINS
jgi:hypothetical protein